MSFRVLICGSRTWDDQKSIQRYVDSLPDDTVVIEGEARGADSIARACAEQRGLEVLPFPADWKRYGKAAGSIRKTQMLMEGRPNMVVAFVYDLESSKGTKNMVDKARTQGVPILVIPEALSREADNGQG